MILNIERMIAEAIAYWQQSNPGKEVKGVLISSRLSKEIESQKDGEEYFDFSGMKIFTTDDLPLFGIEIIAK